MALRVESRKVSRRYSAERLTASACFCPACGRRLERADVGRCIACGFTGADTMKLFPFSPPPPCAVADHAGLWSPKELQRLEREVGRFSVRFPQFDLRIVTADLDPALDLCLFAFWLLNAMPLADGENAERREWCMLLVIRPDGAVAVAPGYSAEVWISAEDWSEMLTELTEDAVDDDLEAAVETFIGSLSRRLMESWKQVEEWRRMRRSRKGQES